MIEDFTDYGEENFQDSSILWGDAFSRRNFCSPSPPRQSSSSGQGLQELETEEVVQRKFTEYHATRKEPMRNIVPKSAAGDFSATHFRRVQRMLVNYQEMSARSVSDTACNNGDGEHAKRKRNVTSDSRGVKRRRVSLNGPAQSANKHVYQVRTAVRRIVFAER